MNENNPWLGRQYLFQINEDELDPDEAKLASEIQEIAELMEPVGE